jgi:hypothetical protein
MMSTKIWRKLTSLRPFSPVTTGFVSILSSARLSNARERDTKA